MVSAYTYGDQDPGFLPTREQAIGTAFPDRDASRFVSIEAEGTSAWSDGEVIVELEANEKGYRVNTSKACVPLIEGEQG